MWRHGVRMPRQKGLHSGATARSRSAGSVPAWQRPASCGGQERGQRTMPRYLAALSGLRACRCESRGFALLVRSDAAAAGHATAAAAPFPRTSPSRPRAPRPPSRCTDAQSLAPCRAHARRVWRNRRACSTSADVRPQRAQVASRKISSAHELWTPVSRTRNHMPGRARRVPCAKGQGEEPRAMAGERRTRAAAGLHDIPSHVSAIGVHHVARDADTRADAAGAGHGGPPALAANQKLEVGAATSGDRALPPCDVQRTQPSIFKSKLLDCSPRTARLRGRCSSACMDGIRTTPSRRRRRRRCRPLPPPGIATHAGH